MMPATRFFLCLTLLSAVPTADAAPRVSAPNAVGPAGARQRTQRAVVLRPNDKPPALPGRLPEHGDQRVNRLREPATFRGPSDVAVLSIRDSTAAAPADKKANARTLSHAAEEPFDVKPLDATAPAPLSIRPTATQPAEPAISPVAASVADEPEPVLEPVPSEPETETQTPAAETPSADNGPRLALAAPSQPRTAGDISEGAPFADFSWMPDSSLTMSTTVAATALVSGLMLLMFAVLKKAAPRSARPLPQEVVSVLGRAPLANKQMAQLMQVGGKLVLVSVGADGAKPITEITDPQEVTRLLGLIEQASPQGASAAFQEVFAQVAKQPTAPGFLGPEPAPLFSSSPMIDRGQLAAAYANTPGGRAHA